MRVYISGPITGVSGYKKHFAAVEARLKEAGHEVINPAKNDMIMPSTATHEEYMRVCLQQESCCDAVCMLDGWKASNGARQEFCYAVDHNIIIFYEEEKKDGNTKQRNGERNSYSVRRVSLLWPAVLIRRIKRNVRRRKSHYRYFKV